MRTRFIILFSLALSLTSVAQTLDDYQQLAMEHNPLLMAKYKEFEAALTRVQQVNQLPDPSLSFGYFISPVETRVGPQRARFSLTQMFPWFGTLKAQGDVASLFAEATFQQFVDDQNRIRFEVAKAYYPLRELNDLKEIQQSNLVLLNTWKRLATGQYENGKTSLAEVLKIDLLIKEIETEVSLLEGQKLPLRVAFNRILNRSDSSTVAFQRDTAKTELSISQAFDWNKHPLILALNMRIEAKQSQSIVIQKQGMPTIGAGLDYVVVGERTDVNVPDNGKNALMPMVTFTLPIFRKKYTSALKENELQIEGIMQSQIAIENDLVSQFENLKYNVSRENELLAFYQIQMGETEQIQSLMLSAFSNSGKDLDELLRIQMQLLNYQTKKIKSQTRLKILAENLDYLLAGISN
ncbi:MAG: cobalt-zinc-cadmium efflux system outer membrane protein [Cyclobacteriaceae bacterium]|jgi:cobalt-zinc-cadmium efflux system outer membrane protein